MDGVRFVSFKLGWEGAGGNTASGRMLAGRPSNTTSGQWWLAVFRGLGWHTSVTGGGPLWPALYSWVFRCTDYVG